MNNALFLDTSGKAQIGMHVLYGELCSCRQGALVRYGSLIPLYPAGGPCCSMLALAYHMVNMAFNCGILYRNNVYIG